MRTAFLALVIITESISYRNVSPPGDSYEISLELFRLHLMPTTPAWNFTGIRNNIFLGPRRFSAVFPSSVERRRPPGPRDLMRLYENRREKS